MTTDSKLRALLQQQLDVYEGMLGKERCYWRSEAFVLRNADVRGRSMKRPQGMRRRTPKQCFANAASLATPDSDFDYCEGFVSHDDIGFPFLHAWLLDKGNGVIVEPTLADPAKYEYLGIRFTPDVLWCELGRTMIFGLLEPSGYNVTFMKRWEDNKP